MMNSFADNLPIHIGARIGSQIKIQKQREKSWKKRERLKALQSNVKPANRAGVLSKCKRKHQAALQWLALKVWSLNKLKTFENKIEISNRSLFIQKMTASTAGCTKWSDITVASPGDISVANRSTLDLHTPQKTASGGPVADTTGPAPKGLGLFLQLL